MKLLNEILGTKYPIIQGGMANIATGEFAAACSNAGALGLIGSAQRTQVRRIINGLFRSRRLLHLGHDIHLKGIHHLGVVLIFHRSEERRVGKECRSRWSPYH